ncbi:MAG: endonuclease/exonuclease/phosphatase family protein [Planctomycetaceae bacterium]
MRLLSYNIHKGIGGRDRKYRLDRILDVIGREDPDVICLQEVDRNVPRSRHQNQPRLFAEHFDAADFAFQLNMHLKTGGYGNLILSRFSFERRHHVSLRMRNKKPRGAQLVVVDTPAGRLHVVNWHLGLAERERRWQVDHLLSHHLFKESEHLPTLIAGDFNDWRNSLANGLFSDRGFDHVTRPISRFRSFPAYMAVGSLDKAFSRDLTIEHARVVRSRRAKTASDHLPLVVDFKLPKKRPKP